MATSFIGMLLVIVGTLFGSVGALFFKKGSVKIALTSIKLYLGFALYFLSSIFFVWGLKHGDLSVLYPLVALSYIWVAFISIIFLKEKMNIWKWLGILAIMVGVTFVNLGSV